MISRFKWYAIRLPISKAEAFQKLERHRYGEEQVSGFVVDIAASSFDFYWPTPDFNFLISDISIGQKIEVNFRIQPTRKDIEFSRLLGAHFERLNLNQRFKYQSSIEIKLLRLSLDRTYQVNNNHTDVEKELRQEANDLKEVLGKNHWKVALYNGLASSRDYCDGGFKKLIL